MAKKVYIDTTNPKLIVNAVESMRKVRDEISNEIKDMTFLEERAFLDRLLKEDAASIPEKKEKGNVSSIH
jgi:hypothetical protein